MPSVLALAAWPTAAWGAEPIDGRAAHAEAPVGRGSSASISEPPVDAVPHDGVAVDEPASAAERAPEPLIDSDGDGRSDASEIAEGTDPLDPDPEETAGDARCVNGVPAYRCLAAPGTEPNTHELNYPEPLIYDLVRGLGARRGELEVNTLAVLPVRRRPGTLAWNPEVEWVFADGFAAELELPFENGELAAVKAVLQGTVVARPSRRDAHGVQLLAEQSIQGDTSFYAATYLGGVRATQWLGFFLIAGPRVNVTPRGSVPVLLANPSVFFPLTRRWVTGVETNLALPLGPGSGRAERVVLVTPQIHWTPTRHLKLQFGFGTRSINGRANTIAATRFTLEL
jgi:hypothetical protein